MRLQMIIMRLISVLSLDSIKGKWDYNDLVSIVCPASIILFIYLCTPYYHYFWKHCQSKLQSTFLALISAMSSIISSCRLWVLPLLLGGPVNPADESRRLCNILVAPPMGNAAMDSRRLRPNRVVGTLEIVTTECRRPPDCGAGVWESVARKAASLADGPEPSPPRSLNRRTYSLHSI